MQNKFNEMINFIDDSYQYQLNNLEDLNNPKIIDGKLY